MSYGSYIDACIDERLRAEFGSTDRKRAAFKFASDNFADYPEQRVYAVLLALKWPTRPVTVGEVSRALRRDVRVSECKAHRRALQDEQIAVSS